MAVIHQFPRRNRVTGYFPMPDGSREKFTGPDVHDVVCQWKAAKVEYWMLLYAV